MSEPVKFIGIATVRMLSETVQRVVYENGDSCCSLVDQDVLEVVSTPTFLGVVAAGTVTQYGTKSLLQYIVYDDGQFSLSLVDKTVTSKRSVIPEEATETLEGMKLVGWVHN
jgi:hypothetical protein